MHRSTLNIHESQGENYLDKLPSNHNQPTRENKNITKPQLTNKRKQEENRERERERV
jgi:hypothetical protein